MANVTVNPGNKSDIPLIFGVQGGGTLDQGSSGQQIEKDLLAIVNAINGKNEMKIKFGVDDESIKKMTEKIQNAISGISDGMSKIGGSSNASAKSSGIESTFSSITSSVTGSTDIIRKDANELAKSIKQIESLMHQLEQIKTKAYSFDFGTEDTTASTITHVEALQKSLNAVEAELVGNDLRANQFATRMQDISLQTKVASDTLNEYVSSAAKVRSAIAEMEKEAQDAATAEIKSAEALERSQKQAEQELANNAARVAKENARAVAEAAKEVAKIYKEVERENAKAEKDMAAENARKAKEEAKIASQIAIEQAKMASQAAKEAEKDILNTVSALSQIQKQRASIDMTLTGVSGTDDLGFAEGSRQSLFEQLKELSTLEGRVNRGTIGNKEFSASLDNIALEAQKAKDSIANYGAAVKVAAQNTLDINSALLQIQKLRSSIDKTLTNVSNMSTLGNAEGSRQSLFDQLGELATLSEKVSNNDVGTKEFAESLGNIALEAQKAKDAIANYVAAEQIASKEALDVSAALTQVQKQRANINKTLTSVSDISDLGVAKKDRQYLFDQLTRLSELEDAVKHETLNGPQFAAALTNITTEAQKATDSITNYVAAQNKLVDNSAAIQKVDAEAAKITSTLQSVERVDWVGTDGRDAREQIEYLKLSLDDLNNLRDRITSGPVTKNEFSKMLNDITEVTNVATDKLKYYAIEAKNATSQTIDIVSAISKIESIEGSINKFRAYAESAGIEKADLPLQQQLDAILGLKQRVFDGSITKNEFAAELEEITIASKKSQDSLSGFVAEQKKLVDTTTALISLESTRHDVEATIQKATNFGDESGTAGFVSQLQDARAEYDKLRQAVEAGSMTNEEFTKRNNELTRSYKEVKNQLSEYIEKKKQEERLDDRILVDSKAYVTANKQIEDSLREVMDAQAKFGSSTNKNIQADVSALGTYRQKLDELYAKLQTGTLTQTEFNHSVQELQNDIRGTISSLNSYESPLQRMKDNLSSVVKQFAGFYTAHRIVYKGISTIRNMINNSVELESAFADTRIVTQATEEEFRNYANTISETAQQVAAPIESLVSATTTFARLGNSLEDSQALAKFTGMLEKVGNIDSKSAEDAITSILKAFPDEANISTIESIMDRLVTTGNHFPISVEQIATAMGNASSALAAAGNDFDHSIALLTAANATVQDASKSSTALRTMASRIRKTDVDVEDGEALSVAKYDEMVQALTRHNVALTEANGEYRSTYEILRDISGVWNDLSNVEQAALADTIAGTRQQTVFYSLIENFHEAEDALVAMKGSAGALAESYDVYLGTAQAHIEQLKAAWQTFSMDAVNSSTVKGFADVGTEILKVADSLAKVNRLLPTLLGAFTAFKGLKLAKSVLEQKVAVEALVASIAKEGTMTKSLSIDFEKLNSVQRQQVVTQLQAAAASGEDAAQKALEVLGVESLTVAEGGATVATDELNVSLKALAASNPFGWVMLGVSVLVTAIMYIKSFADSAEDTARSIADMESELKQLGSESSRIASDYRNLKQSADEVIPKFVELSRGVNEYGENVSLTDEQYKEFISLNNQIADLIPGINLGYDSNGNAIIDLKDRADMLAESLWGAVDAQRALSAEQIAGSTKDAFDTAAEITERKRRNAEIAIDVLNSVLDIQNSTDFALASDYTKQARVYQNIQDTLSKYADNDADMFNSLLISSGVYEVEKYEDYVTVLERIRHETENATKNTSEWTEATKGFVASAQTLVDDPLLRDAVGNLVSEIDISSFNTDDGYLAVQTYIDQNIIAPINDMDDDAHAAIVKLLDVKGAFLDGNASAYEYSKAINGVSDALDKAGVSGKLAEGIMKSFGSDVFVKKFDTVKKRIYGINEEVNKFINSLSADKLEIVYSIVSENGRMSLDDLKAKIEELDAASVECAEDLGEIKIDDLFKDLDKRASAIDKVTDAMKKLSKGTALTTKELTDLVKQYPDLLKQSNLYTDGSIAGQQKLLEVCLECEQKEYEATVDAEIKKLNAKIKALDLEGKAKIEMTMFNAALAKNAAEEGVSVADAVAAAKAYAEAAAQAAEYQTMIENLESLKDVVFQNIINETGRIDSGYYSSSSSSSSSTKNEYVAALDEWKKVKDLIDAGIAQIDYAQYIYELMDKVQKLLEQGKISPEEAAKYIKEYQKAIEDFSKNAEKAIDNLVQYRIKVIKSVYEEEKKELQQRLKNLKEFYDEQKDMLDEQLKHEKYVDEQAEKRKAVSELKQQIEMLSMDNSAAAQKKIAELREKLDEEQKKLDDFERDNAYDSAKDILDKQYEAQEKQINAEIEAIDAKLNDPKALYNQALSDIQSNSEAIYNEMKAYAEDHSTNGKNEFVELWEAAIEAIAEYTEFQNIRPYSPDEPYGSYYIIGPDNPEYVGDYDGFYLPSYNNSSLYSSANGGKYRLLPSNNMSIGAQAADFLYRFASGSGISLMDTMRPGSSYNNITNGGSVVINAGDIIVNGGADEKTVSEIRRAQRDSIEFILREFSKLK